MDLKIPIEITVHLTYEEAKDFLRHMEQQGDRLLALKDSKDIQVYPAIREQAKSALESHLKVERAVRAACRKYVKENKPNGSSE